jgi:hypothetical protein
MAQDLPELLLLQEDLELQILFLEVVSHMLLVDMVNMMQVQQLDQVLQQIEETEEMVQTSIILAVQVDPVSSSFVILYNHK